MQNSGILELIWLIHFFKATLKHRNMSRDMINQQNECAPSEDSAQTGQGIRPVWSETSQAARRNLGFLATHWAHIEDSGQTGRTTDIVNNGKTDISCNDWNFWFIFMSAWSHLHIFVLYSGQTV